MFESVIFAASRHHGDCCSAAAVRLDSRHHGDCCSAAAVMLDVVINHRHCARCKTVM